LSTSEPTEFDEWLASSYREAGSFTVLAILTEIRDHRITPVCTTYFHVVGDEADWDTITALFMGSGQQWDGAAFFPVGGPLDNPSARQRLKELDERVTKDRMTLNEGHFFDILGRRIRIEPAA
jgi:hypothetical protein